MKRQRIPEGPFRARFAITRDKNNTRYRCIECSADDSGPEAKTFTYFSLRAPKHFQKCHAQDKEWQADYAEYCSTLDSFAETDEGASQEAASSIKKSTVAAAAAPSSLTSPLVAPDQPTVVNQNQELEPPAVPTGDILLSLAVQSFFVDCTEAGLNEAILDNPAFVRFIEDVIYFGKVSKLRSFYPPVELSSILSIPFSANWPGSSDLRAYLPVSMSPSHPMPSVPKRTGPIARSPSASSETDKAAFRDRFQNSKVKNNTRYVCRECLELDPLSDGSKSFTHFALGAKRHFERYHALNPAWKHDYSAFSGLISSIPTVSAPAKAAFSTTTVYINLPLELPLVPQKQASKIIICFIIRLVRAANFLTRSRSRVGATTEPTFGVLTRPPWCKSKPTGPNPWVSVAYLLGARMETSVPR